MFLRLWVRAPRIEMMSINAESAAAGKVLNYKRMRVEKAKARPGAEPDAQDQEGNQLISPFHRSRPNDSPPEAPVENSGYAA